MSVSAASVSPSMTPYAQPPPRVVSTDTARRTKPMISDDTIGREFQEAVKTGDAKRLEGAVRDAAGTLNAPALTTYIEEMKQAATQPNLPDLDGIDTLLVQRNGKEIGPNAKVALNAGLTLENLMSRNAAKKAAAAA